MLILWFFFFLVSKGYTKNLDGYLICLIECLKGDSFFLSCRLVLKKLKMGGANDYNPTLIGGASKLQSRT